jgi:hypothetical protein
VLGYASDSPSVSTTRTFVGFPASAGSFHLLLVTAIPNSQTFDRYRAAGVVFGGVGAKTIALGPDHGGGSVTAAATSPVLRLQGGVAFVAPYNSLMLLSATQTGTLRSVVVQVTSAYLGATAQTPAEDCEAPDATQVRNTPISVPDLSSASYLVDWGLRANAATAWTLSAQGLSGFGTQGQYAEGATIFISARSGTLAAGLEQQNRR